MHMVFDLDGPCDGEAHSRDQQVRTAFARLLEARFQADFRRAVDWRGCQWETTTRAGRLSLHLHVPAEVFVSAEDHRRWVTQSLAPFMMSEAEDGNRHAEALVWHEASGITRCVVVQTTRSTARTT